MSKHTPMNEMNLPFIRHSREQDCGNVRPAYLPAEQGKSALENPGGEEEAYGKGEADKQQKGQVKLEVAFLECHGDLQGAEEAAPKQANE